MKNELEQLRIAKEHKVAHAPRSRWSLVMLLLLLVGGGGGAAWYFTRPGNAPVVEVLRVRLPDLTASSQTAGGGGQNDLVALNATGYLMAAHKIELASKVVGRVAWVGVEMGDKVKKDDILVRLEDDEFKARVAQAQGQLDAAKAKLAELKAGNRPEEIAQMQANYRRTLVELENAQRAYRRVTADSRRTSTSQAEIDDAEALMKSRQAAADAMLQQLNLMKEGPRKEQIAAQQATVAQLEAVLAQATLDLNNTIIRAPLDATVLERNVEAGEFVTTGFVGDRGAKGYVLSIANLRDLLVELDISQNDFAKVIADGPCWVTTDAYPDRKYDGKVELISPVANRQKATIQVRVKILNPDDLLKPDMNATVAFLAKPISSNATRAGGAAPERPPLRIPASALRGNKVFILENHRAHAIPVATGRTSTKGDIEILTGLLGGEELILNPPDTLKDNDPVTPRVPPS